MKSETTENDTIFYIENHEERGAFRYGGEIALGKERRVGGYNDG